MPTTTRQIDWVAGIVEGEGCLLWDKANNSPVLRVSMSDRDVVNRLAQIWGTKNPPGYDRKDRPDFKTLWTVQIWSSRAVGWCMILHDILGERRQAKARELILRWKEKQ